MFVCIIMASKCVGIDVRFCLACTEKVRGSRRKYLSSLECRLWHKSMCVCVCLYGVRVQPRLETFEKRQAYIATKTDYLTYTHVYVYVCIFIYACIYACRFPGLEAWLEAFEKRQTYLATKGDYYTHVTDIPPQYGDGQPVGEAQQYMPQIDGREVCVCVYVCMYAWYVYMSVYVWYDHGQPVGEAQQYMPQICMCASVHVCLCTCGGK